MIMWPKAKRGVSDDMARQIAHEATLRNVRSVGVFVDEDAETITRRCTECGIQMAQLHGDGARSSLAGLPDSLQVIWVCNATADGKIQTSLPPLGGRKPSWLLLDGMQGGSGQALDWTQLNPPADLSLEGWLLAGGLKPENVATAAGLAKPNGVDVSSGVCGPDGGLKPDNVAKASGLAKPNGVDVSSGIRGPRCVLPSSQPPQAPLIAQVPPSLASAAPPANPRDQPPPRPILYTDNFPGSPDNVAQACLLVTSAVEDLKEAVDALHRRGGLFSAAKTGLASATGLGEKSTAAETGKTIIHDARQVAVIKVKAAHVKYEKAASLVEGLPEIQAADIKQGNAVFGDRGGKTGGGVQSAAMAGVDIAGMVLGVAGGAGIISRVVKKKRIKKAVPGVMAMMHEYEAVQKKLADQMINNGQTPPKVGETGAVPEVTQGPNGPNPPRAGTPPLPDMI
eukprot:gene15830-21954_t